ncbi:MAG: hypothetical protein MI743_01765 [Sneathiellales bacterium]|nr:hypothetical protein [Sneathiellales bacterium]
MAENKGFMKSPQHVPASVQDPGTPVADSGSRPLWGTAGKCKTEGNRFAKKYRANAPC